MIITLHYLHCTECNREFEEAGESIKQVRRYAKLQGWIYKKVENGSYWDLPQMYK